MLVSKREMFYLQKLFFTPPLLLMRPVVNFSIHNADKADIPAEIHKHRFYELCDPYVDYCSIYQ